MGQKRKDVVQGRRCPACGSTLTYMRVKTAELVCRACLAVDGKVVKGRVSHAIGRDKSEGEDG